MGEVKRQEWQWFPKTKGVRKYKLEKIGWVNFEFLEINRCPEGVIIGFKPYCAVLSGRP